MRLSLILSLVLPLLAAPAMAMDSSQMEFYGQGIVALPMGNFGDVANVGIGAGLGVRVPLQGIISLRGEISYVYYTTDAPAGVDLSFSQIPILVLAEFRPAEMPVYFLGGVGLAYSMSSVKIGGASADDNSTDPALVGGVGFNASPKLFLEGRLQLVSDANQVSGHVGYRF
jgi:hypothetical protein